MKTQRKSLKGFSLIEILIVIALMAILATITIAAINPAKNFADARNTQRSSDVNTILNALSQYVADGKVLPTGITTCPATVTVGTTVGTGFVDLTFLTNSTNDYLVAIPVDPQEAGAADTGYTVCKTSTNRLEVAASNAENEKTISVRR